MALLPVERIKPSPPFTYTGDDCFGPLIIKRGRTEVKRWGCIFTCLSTRALHLEKLDSMSTDSFLNALVRFQIRSIRKVLTVTLNTQVVSDEVLNTVLVMAEGILNNRPISKLSEDPHDPTPLRPSDLLLVSHRDTSPTVQTFSSDLYKKSWRQAQYLTEIFWSKWIHHYLPELQGRQKWR